MTHMNSIGNSIKNFFSTTVTVTDANKREQTVDKATIREALKQMGVGFWDRLKVMKAIRQANCNMDNVKSDGLKKSLQESVTFMQKKLSNRGVQKDPHLSEEHMIKKDSVDAFKKCVEEKTIANEFQSYKSMDQKTEQYGREMDQFTAELEKLANGEGGASSSVKSNNDSSTASTPSSSPESEFFARTEDGKWITLEEFEKKQAEQKENAIRPEAINPDNLSDINDLN